MAAEDGLVCGGTMYFLIDPAYRPDDYQTYASEIEEAYKGGRAVALASIVKPSDSGRGTGEKLFVREDGSTDGTLGSEELDHEAIKKASDLMAYGKSEYVKADDGAEYFIEAYTTPPQMVLCGGGHVSKAIAPLAKSLGFRVFITDDREEFANADRFPEADIVVSKTPEVALAELPINANSFVIIATRGHRYDNVRPRGGQQDAGEVRRPPGQQAKDDPDLRGPHPQRSLRRPSAGNTVAGPGWTSMPERRLR